MHRSEDTRISAPIEMTIVSVAPQRAANPCIALKKLAPILAEERKAWKGVDATTCGVPLGIKPRTNSQLLDSLEVRSKDLLHDLPDSEVPRPSLVRFFPLRDSSQCRDMWSSLHPRTTAVQSADLTYKLHKSDGKLVKAVLEQAGFAVTESQDWTVLWAGAAPSDSLYEGLGEFQKINHFPGATQLTRKDLMYANLLKLQNGCGKTQLDFVPETYVLPSELPDFLHRFEDSKNQIWIAKPSASSQGKGIFLVETIDQLPTTESYIVSHYISNPLLINSLKFDMRIYVLVTSYDPMRIYVYEEGLARFASEEYTNQGRKDARYMHLTNYSVNKRNENYVANQDYRKDNVGHKWSLSALFKYLEGMGVDIEFVWEKIYDLIIKSIISVQESIVESCSELSVNARNCFDLFGFDVLLDSSLKPWLLEVNLSPSLATESSLDSFIKGHLITDTFNLVGIRTGDRRKEANKQRFRLRNKRKPENGSAPPSRPPVPGHVPSLRSLSDGSPRLKDAIRDTLEEFDRRGHFIRIYPSKRCEYYDQFFNLPQTVGKWIHWVLFEGGTLECVAEAPTLSSPGAEPVCASASILQHRSKLQFSKPRNSSIAIRKLISRGKAPFDKRISTALPRDKSFSTYSVSSSKVSAPQGGEKIVVTGDDILMEYIARLVRTLMNVSEDVIAPVRRKNIEAFISHPVWKNTDARLLGKDALWQRLEGRYSEMRVRRLRITESEARIKGGSRENTHIEEQRRSVVSGFTALQLEDMLRASTRNVAREVVLPLLDHSGGGVLSDLLSSLSLQKSVSSHIRPSRDLSNSEEEESEKSPLGSPSNKRRDSLEPLSQILRISWKLNPGKPRPQSMAKSMRG